MVESNLFRDIVEYEVWARVWMWYCSYASAYERCPICGGTMETCTCGTIDPNRRKKG